MTVMRLLPTSSSIRLPSRASRTASTSQALSDWPIRFAASSARILTDSGRRRVIRDWLSSSGSGAAGAADGAGGAAGRPSAAEAGDHELRLAAAHPHVDRVVVEGAGDLGGGLGQRLEQHHPGGGVEGEGEAVGGCLCLGATGRCGVGQVAAESFDEGCEFHDATMTSL